VSERILVAGVGNVFRGDDGFGVAVARRLAEEPLPPGVQLCDYGVRGVHLAYELLNGYDLLVLVDAVARGGQPGTLYVIEPDGLPVASPAALVDAHDLTPDAVLALVPVLGGTLGRVVVVGCEPASLCATMALSAVVEQSVEEATRVVREVVSAASRETHEKRGNARA
jgi:hydrogenase maturation protease